MNEYYVKVNFEKRLIQTNLKKLVQNDYNSTKLNFTFDKEGRVLFKMLYPDGTQYVDEIQNNELIFGKGVLNQEGDYEYEISLYTEDGRLTDYATKSFEVRSELVNTDEIVKPDDRVPVLDTLINEVSTIKQDVEEGKYNGKDGKNGITPTIGENGNWFIGDVDTGKTSRGEPGVPNGEAIVYTLQELTDEQKTQARENISAVSTTDMGIVVSGFLGDGKSINPVISQGYVHPNTGTISSNTSEPNHWLRAKTETHISVKGNFLILVPEGFCARVFYYEPTYTRYDNWKTGVIHVNSDKEITITLTFAHNDISQTMTDEDIAFIQENLIMGNCEIASEQGVSNEEAILYTPQELTEGQKEQARKNISASSTSDLEATLKALLGNNEVPIIELGYINANTGEVSNSTTAPTYLLRARTKTKTVVNGDFLIVIPEGFCARVMRYSPSYQGYDDWASGIIHLKSEEEMTIHLTLAHIDTTQAITDEDIAFIQENLLIGNSSMAGSQSSGADIPLYEDSASSLKFEFGTILSSNGANSDATARIRTIDYLPAKNFTCSVDSGYKFVLYYYDANQVLIQKTSWITIPTYVDITTIEDCEYIRLLVAKNGDGVITNDEFNTVKNALHLFYGTVDTTLTQKGIPADAYTVGEMLKGFGEPAKKSIRILGIGNSYTRDSFRWLWKILTECGYSDVVVAHGYWGGSTLEQQYESLNTTSANYSGYTYWKYTSQKAKQTANSNLPTIITDEPWDIVLFQQQSDWAGQYESFVSDTFDINNFISYVKNAIGNNNLKIGIASTWSHAKGYNSEKFEEMYGGNPETQYQAINETIPQVANHMSQCDFVVHTGKAVELGRANQFLSALGDEMLRPDKNHLAFGIPSFMAGMVYAITLCGVKPCDLSWYPTTTDDAEIVTETSAYLAYLAKQCALVASQHIA